MNLKTDATTVAVISALCHSMPLNRSAGDTTDKTLNMAVGRVRQSKKCAIPLTLYVGGAINMKLPIYYFAVSHNAHHCSTLK